MIYVKPKRLLFITIYDAILCLFHKYDQNNWLLFEFYMNCLSPGDAIDYN